MLLFGLDRNSATGGTPVARWQFQLTYPSYPPWVTVRPGGELVLGIPRTGPWAHVDAGHATTVAALAAFLRSYQLDGGYAPGPLLALFSLTGITGACLLLRRKGQPPRALTQASLLCIGCGVAILLMSDVFEFTWRYQLPALVTLPPAGAAGAAALLSLRGRVAGFSEARRADRSPAVVN
jgi:hypothetical protein